MSIMGRHGTTSSGLACAVAPRYRRAKEAPLKGITQRLARRLDYSTYCCCTQFLPEEQRSTMPVFRLIWFIMPVEFILPFEEPHQCAIKLFSSMERFAVQNRIIKIKNCR
jgi:hypothetical protein